ncbi:MAG: antibiotic biosynthesis monooxygenase [Opitutae bacterium]|nr:antibiotic biosynthesis monooxygenase [Opitutae bacterium]
MNTEATASDDSGPIHVVITRRVRPGCEAQYQDALRSFFQSSFAHDGVLGASMIVPPPGSGSTEFGILRTFASARDRDAFYASPLFQEWNKTVAPFAEDDWTSRQLHGMEAWFRSPRSAPARWKMALLTWAAVWPATVAVRALLQPLLGATLPAVLFAGAVAAGVVVLLTWLLMPWLVRAARGWLQPPEHPKLGEARRYGRG